MPGELTGVSDFVQRSLTASKNGAKPIAFRGQSFTDWATLARVFRPNVGIIDHEKDAIRDLISVHPHEFDTDATMFDKLVRMQHFELPTRLLDVTHNPLVALYFATEVFVKDGVEQDGKVQAFYIPQSRCKYYDSDRVSCMANIANLTKIEKDDFRKAIRLSKDVFNKSEAAQRLLWFVKLEKPAFLDKIVPEDLRLPVYVKPKMSNRRIIAQSGAFILYGTHSVTRSSEDEDLNITRVIIPADKKRLIRNELALLGISGGTLFPELDKASAVIVEKYRSK